MTFGERRAMLALLLICIVTFVIIAYAVLFPHHSPNEANENWRWIRSRIPVGTTRAFAYTRLRERGLEAYNPDYQLGKPKNGGCTSVDDDFDLWPRRNEPMPAYNCGYGIRHRPVVEPEAYVDLDAGSAFFCGVRRTVTLTFDRNDRVASRSVTGILQTCL